MQLPVQSAPVYRESLTNQAYLNGTNAVESAQSMCDGLTGLAQQICYGLEFGISV